MAAALPSRPLQGPGAGTGTGQKGLQAIGSLRRNRPARVEVRARSDCKFSSLHSGDGTPALTFRESGTVLGKLDAGGQDFFPRPTQAQLQLSPAPEGPGV